MLLKIVMLGLSVDITGVPKTQNITYVSIIEKIGKIINTELNVIEIYRINCVSLLSSLL